MQDPVKDPGSVPPRDAAQNDNLAHLTYRGCAMPWQCDQMGHMNARHIYAAFDDATAGFVSFLGAPFSDSRSSALGWADVHQTLDFRREINDGEMITVRTRVIGLGRTSITFIHAMTIEDDDTPAACLTSKTVRFDLAARRAAPLEAALRERVQSLVMETSQ